MLQFVLGFREIASRNKYIKKYLYRNSYLSDFVDQHKIEFLDRVLTPKTVVSTMPKKDWYYYLWVFKD